jgi:hypothetical protein
MVFTGEAVIEAIMSGRLSVDDAFRRGLIAIDASPEANRDVLILLRAGLGMLAHSCDKAGEVMKSGTAQSRREISLCLSGSRAGIRRMLSSAKPDCLI